MRNSQRIAFGLLMYLVSAASADCRQQDGVMSPSATRRPADPALERRALALLQRAARSEDGLVRANALEALVKLAPEEHLPAFREAVVSEAPLVRYAGCVALGAARDKDSLRALCRVMDEDPDVRVRLAAAFAATRCGDRHAAQLLVDVLNDHPDDKMRADAAYLLGELREPKAAKRLKLAGGREISGEVVLQIETALAKLGDREKLDRLIQYALKSDTVTVLLSLQSLAEIADPSAEKALEYRLFSKIDYLQTKLLAARGLGEIGNEKGYKLALTSLNHKAKDESETMQVRSNAALALGAIGKQEALPALARLAENESDSRTQVAACYAIVRISRGTQRP